MSKIVKTLGLVVSEAKFGEGDKMLTVLTPTLGKISVMVKKCYGSKNMAGATEIMCLSNMVLYKGSKSYHLNEVELKENFYEMRYSFEKMETVAEILKHINKTINKKYTIDEELDGMEIEEMLEIFKLIVSSLYSIYEISQEGTEEKITEQELEKIVLTYYIKLFHIIGLSTETAENFKDTKEERAYKVIQYIQKTGIPKCFAFSTEKEILKVIRNILGRNNIL